MAHSRSKGRISGQGSERNWLEDGGREKRADHAYKVAKSAIGQAGKCPRCEGRTTCRDSRVTPGNGAKSWWVCSVCGHVSTREITPAKMALYYTEDALKQELTA